MVEADGMKIYQGILQDKLVYVSVSQRIVMNVSGRYSISFQAYAIEIS